MGTTDQRLKAAHERGTDDTDEEQRRISDGGFIPRLGRIQSNLPVFVRFFIRGIGVIRGRTPFFGCGFRIRRRNLVANGRRHGYDRAFKFLVTRALVAKV
jgi:hypothetical protein